MRLAALIIPAAIVGQTVARADPKELQLGVNAGYSILFGSQNMSGYGVGVRAAYGLSWSLAVTLEGHYSAHPLSSRHGQVVFAAGGLEWALDVLRWVPFFRVEAAAYWLQDPAFGHSTSAGAGFSLGVDYRLARPVSFGFYGRYHVLVTDLNQFPAYMDMGLRLTAHLDY